MLLVLWDESEQATSVAYNSKTTAKQAATLGEKACQRH